jgi:hypothetical protein
VPKYAQAVRLPILALIAAGTFTGVSLANAQAVFVRTLS